MPFLYEKIWSWIREENGLERNKANTNKVIKNIWRFRFTQDDARTILKELENAKKIKRGKKSIFFEK